MTLLRRPGAALSTLLFLLVGAAFLTQVVPYRQILDSQRQVSATRAELAALEAKNTLLEADVAALHTDAEIEKLAREKLGYVLPGETAYIVLDPPAEAKPPAPPPAAAEIPEELTWVDKFWNFIAGNDIDS